MERVVSLSKNETVSALAPEAPAPLSDNYRKLNLARDVCRALRLSLDYNETPHRLLQALEDHYTSEMYADLQRTRSEAGK